MSLIDTYKHTCLGIVSCPFMPEYEPRFGAFPHIPIYRIDADAQDEDPGEFQAKAGDILLGGGRGETEAFRLSFPEAFYYHTHEDWDTVGFMWQGIDTVQKAYWSASNAYLFGFGYAKLGWSIHTLTIEDWLAGHLITFLSQNYHHEYGVYVGSEKGDKDGTICRLLTSAERTGLGCS